MEEEKVLVYVQATPVNFPSGKTFSDFTNSSFIMAHSSKTALAKVQKLFPKSEIHVAGFSAVIPEAIARGAAFGIPIPFFDSPLEQAREFPTSDSYSHVVCGENSEGPFSGASLCGALASLRKMDLTFFPENSDSLPVKGIVLLQDEPFAPPNIDIRRINFASQEISSSSIVLGNKLVEGPNMAEKPSPIRGDSAHEIALSISRWLRKFSF